MQTVNQVIDSASKAIWGDKISQQQQEQHGSEPVSGVTGKGTATDPYDAGNREEQPDAPATETGGVDPSNEPATYPTTGSQSDSNSDATAAGSERPGILLEKTAQQSEEDNDTLGYTAEEVSDDTKQKVSRETLEGPQGPPKERSGLVGGEGLGDENFGNPSAQVRQDDPGTSTKPGSQNVSGKGSKIAKLRDKLHVPHTHNP